jgi:aspartate/methionine/tyrosine aminotransferase
MQAPVVDIFEWLLSRAPHARYNLAYSNIQGMTVQEYQKLTNFSFPPDFDLGVNQQYGAPELKETLCSQYHCNERNIVTTTGATEANFLLFSSLLDTGDEVIIEQPVYQPLLLTPQVRGARVITWPRAFEQKFSINIETLKHLVSKKTRLVVLTNLHNPSGVYTDTATIRSVAEIAADHGVYVLVDELFLDGASVKKPSCFGVPNVIVTSSVTKIYGLGGLHTGWLAAPEEIAAQCQRLKAHTTGSSSYTAELMTARLLKNARDAAITRFQSLTRSNRAVVKEWIQNQELLRWVEPDGGLVCFPKYSLAVPSVDLCTYLFDTHKILVNPGTYFDAEGFIRLSYGIETDVLKEGLDAFAAGLNDIHHR